MITSTSNARIKRLVNLKKKRKLRDEEGVFLVEGIRMFREVPLDKLKEVYVSESFYKKEKDTVKEVLKDSKIRVEELTDTVFSHASDTKTPQGILCVVEQMNHKISELTSAECPLIMVLDHLQDPGNLGTILRTAEGAGVTGILMDRECVDIYNPKTIRSTMGSVYRMPFVYVEDLGKGIQDLKDKGITTYAAHLEGTNSYDETYETLRYTSKRAKLEDQVVAAAVAAGVDGINLDFELISSKCGVHYVQLVRELSVKCHQNNLVFSVDNYVPQSYNSHYDLKEQGIVADYVVIMAYDEHTEGSYEAGSVASISYLQDGIEKTLKKVSADKVIAGIPFFTRLWFETAKSPEQLSEEAGTEAASYPNKVSSKALGMEEAAQSVVNAGATAQWDEKTQQNYAKWSADGGTYRIWLEDAQSLEAKLKVIQENKLAGVAEWSLGKEESSVWKLISQYVN